MKQQNVCEKDGHLVDLKTVLSGYDLGGTWAYLTKAQRDALKPQGDDTVEILYFIDASEYGWGFDPSIAKLTGNVRCVVPNTTLSASALMSKRWAALLAMMHGKAAVAKVMDGGSFTYAVLVPTASGAMLAHDLYLPEDTYELPVVDVPPLSEEEFAAFHGKGDELTLPFDVQSVWTDPFREARYNAIAAAARGEPPIPAAAPHEPETALRTWCSEPAPRLHDGTPRRDGSSRRWTRDAASRRCRATTFLHPARPQMQSVRGRRWHSRSARGCDWGISPSQMWRSYSQIWGFASGRSIFLRARPASSSRILTQVL